MALSILRAVAVFTEYLTDSGYNRATIKSRLSYLKRFTVFLPPECDVRNEGKKQVADFVAQLAETELKRSTKRMILCTVRLFFKALYVNELILSNPAEDRFLLPDERSKPKAILSEAEVQVFLDGIDIQYHLNLRDRTLFELIYSSGLRAGEAARLIYDDIDWKSGTVLIRHGKNKKDRIVPVNEVALTFLESYLRGRKAGAVFVGEQGPLVANTINKRFKFHLKQQNMYRKGLSVHSLRHSVAVHLLSHGADLRYVQELLGHESVETTVIYTRQLYDELKRVYRMHHPRENEYYREVDADYHRKIGELKEHLLRCERKRKRKGSSKS